MFWILTIFIYFCKMNFDAKIHFMLYQTDKKRLKFIFLVTIAVFMAVFELSAQEGAIRKVVIDAGHGGKDPGALGKKSREKDITLKVALKTGHYIEKYCPDVEVVYTRSKDVFLSLNQRAKVANDEEADVFISIHCNSAPKSTSAVGVETFVMGDHRNAANLEVAKLENAAILYEEDADVSYDGFDPNSTEAYIAFSFLQSEYKQKSLDLAERIQTQLVNRVGRKNRGVQQAGFLVLYRTAMPSVLVEIGFLSNLNEEKFLLSEQGQTYIASAIFRAFRDYKKESDENLKNTANPDDADVKTDITVYKVQFDSRPEEVSDVNSYYKGLDNVSCYYYNGGYRYTAGQFDTKEKADSYCKTVRTKGYKDAFVVKFVNGERVK